MGKAALILVAAVSIASGAAYLNQDRAALDTVEQEALYEHQVLAREIAQSGFNRIESRVRRDYNNHRVQLGNLDHPRGRLDISSVGATGEPVSISATGYYEDAEYTISGTLSKTGTRVLDALTIDAIVSEVTFESGALVSGVDTNPDGSSGENMDVHAMLTTQNDTYVALVAEVLLGRAPGMAGLLDIVDDTPEVNVSQLADNILDFSGSARVDYSGETNLEDVTIGSWQNPSVVVVDGDLTLSGSTTGYGILYSSGGLEFEGDSRWEGLVMVENNGGAHAFRDQSRVYGAVVIRSVWSAEFEGGDDQGLPGGHFDVDVFDDFSAGDYRYHQHKYDDEFDATGVDLLDPDGCGSGGLCWDSILGDQDAVYVEFMNPEMGYGTYEIIAAEGEVVGECEGGGGSGSDDTDDSGSDDDDDDGGCWWCWWTNVDDAPSGLIQGTDDLVAGGMPADVRAAGFTNLSWMNALGKRVLTLFPMYGGKVDVCHIPPGNPSNAHTINISENAVDAHLAHGDYLGECNDSDDDDDSGSDDDDDWWDDDDDGGSDDDDDDSDDDDDGDWWDDDDDGGSDDDDDGGSDDADDDDDSGSGEDQEEEESGSDCDDTSVGIPSANLQGNTHEGLSPTLMDAREVSTFQVNFEYLCALQISSPNGVIYDPTDRNSAFTIRIYEADLDGTTWSQGDLAYELSVYHHTGYGWDSNPGGDICDPATGTDGMLAGDEVDIDFEDSATIQYSSRALYRVRNLLSQVDPGEGQISLGDVREEGVRPEGLNQDQ